jgi:hypothetical protein
MYSVDVFSTSRGGKVCKLLDATVGFVGGYVSPIVIRLLPGAADYVSIDLKKLICIGGRTTTTLDSLLRQGHSVSASFTGKLENNGWAKVPNGWTGTVLSGTFHSEAPKQRQR